MSETPYQQGNPVVLSATFDVGSTPTDPTTVTFNIRRPDGTLASYVYETDAEVTRVAAGQYDCDLGVPEDAGQYHYEAVGTGDVVATLPGEFFVIPSSVAVPQEVAGPVLGPCQTWIDGSDLADCPGADGLSPQKLDAIAVTASMVMYEVSARQFSGVCGPVTVRPCSSRSCSGLGAPGWGWGSWFWSWGYYSGTWGWGWWDGVSDEGSSRCGCGSDSTIELQGYPIREVVEVKIDGEVVPPTYDGGAPQYRLDMSRYLTRMSDPDNPDVIARWPLCQRLDLQDDQPGTFSVKYTYGVPPPPAGLLAAQELACQMIPGAPCKLPPNATKIVRQGVTIERVTPLASEIRKGATGLLFVDSFIAAYNPRGLRRRPAVFTPDITRPPRVGNQ